MLLSADWDSQNKLGKGKGEYAFSTKDDDKLESVSSAPEWFQINDIRLMWGKVWYLWSGDDVPEFLLQINMVVISEMRHTYFKGWITYKWIAADSAHVSILKLEGGY